MPVNYRKRKNCVWFSEETTTGTGETGTGLSIEGRSGNVSTQRLGSVNMAKFLNVLSSLLFSFNIIF